MPLYDYLCDTCGTRSEEVYSIHDDSAHTPCLTCGASARKVITSFPGVTHGMVREAHYNMTVGKHIKNDAEFKSELTRKSDEMANYSGHPVDFQPIDHRDAKEHLGVTDEGMDSTYSKQVESGEREVIKHL